MGHFNVIPRYRTRYHAGNAKGRSASGLSWLFTADKSGGSIVQTIEIGNQVRPVLDAPHPVETHGRPGCITARVFKKPVQCFGRPGIGHGHQAPE